MALYHQLVWNSNYDPLLSCYFVSPKTLAIYRAIIALYCFAFTLHWLALGYFSWLKYFTVWNWMILTLYFAVVGILGLHTLYSKKTDSDTKRKNQINAGNSAKNISIAKNQPKWIKLRIFASILLVIECVNVIIIDLIVWCLLVPFMDPKDHYIFINYFSYVMHIANFFFVYFDFFANCLIFDDFVFAMPIVWMGLIYIAFIWIWVQFMQNVS